MKKKVTIRDIAREAGVSAATVSYIINNRQDQSISEETKQKVWHIINLFNYEPNVFAKNLRSANTTKFIAVYGGENSPLMTAEYVNILKTLKDYFEPLKYAILFASAPYAKLDYADAIVACNISLESFRQIGGLNFIPLVAVDCLVNDPVFFQITTDYQALKKQADEYFAEGYVFVCILPEDDALRKEIENTFERTAFASDLNDLDKICSDKNVVTCEKLIYKYCKEHRTNVYFSEKTYAQKCQTIAACLQKALSHETYAEHSFKV